MRLFWSRLALIGLAASFWACSGSSDDEADDTDAGGGSVVVPGGSDTLTTPPCAENEAYVRAELAGPKGGMFAWEAADFTECHGGGVYGEASLQFNLKGAAGEGTFYVTLNTQPQVAVGMDLPAEVRFDIEGLDLNLSWNEGCVAQITDVHEIDRFDNGGPAVGIWERYTGSVVCAGIAKPIFSPDEYTLPAASFQGISYRLEM